MMISSDQVVVKSQEDSFAIKQEIQRFESVHPRIYAIYDLLELIDDIKLGQQIRDHVVCIEDSFVNSQEWTLSRSVTDLRLGIVGSLSSGKSALVHRYLTGSFIQDEWPEGGRFKKEVTVDGKSYMLLIRDEGGLPETQFSHWIDAVIFVFSLHNEASFNCVWNYFTSFREHRIIDDIPIILVGTQDTMGDGSCRVIDEVRAKKLAMEMKKDCSYFETCAAYGLNVEKVFQEACQKIAFAGMGHSPPPSTPTSNSIPPNTTNSDYNRLHSINNLTSFNSISSKQPSAKFDYSSYTGSSGYIASISTSPTANAMMNHHHYHHQQALTQNKNTHEQNPGPVPPKRIESKMIDSAPSTPPASSAPSKPHFSEPISFTGISNSIFSNNRKDCKEFITPTSTPNITRKNRRRSNLFPQLSNKNKSLDEKNKNGELGIGRTIPLRQGYLYKKSMKPLNKDWKKKYVTLTIDGCLTYHPTLHDYMGDVHGKNIPLKHTTVKIPGQKPRGSRPPTGYSGPSSLGDTSSLGDVTNDLNSFHLGSENGSEKIFPSTNPLMAKESSSGKKHRHRRLKSSNKDKKDDGTDGSDGYEFVIVSLDNKQWHFEASNCDEREAWVSAIEQQILSSLQELESDKSKYRIGGITDKAAAQAIRAVKGNSHCIDCDAPNPDWASLNLGALICIECSGIHRNLGTHISRVRSLDLDDWPPSHVAVMTALGNSLTNEIFESNCKGRIKPTTSSGREEKERWIRSKYERREFMAPLNSVLRLEQQLFEAINRSDVPAVAHVLAHALSSEQINFILFQSGGKSPLHLAAEKGSLAIVQLLIWYNAKVNIADSDGKTALYYARLNRNKDIEELLIQQGCTETSTFSDNACLPRRRESLNMSKASDVFDKLPASII